MRKLTAALSGLALVCAVAAAPGAAAADADMKVRSWSKAATVAGDSGSLWEPMFTAGLKRAGKIAVQTRGLTVDASTGAANGGEMVVSAQYGRQGASITIAEKFAGTQWAADLIFGIDSAKVGTTTIMLGEPGTQIKVTATVYANCYVQALTGDAPPPPASLRCARGDVKKYGGDLVMTAMPSSTMTAPGTTDVVIETEGITYKQLLRIASSLQQVMG